MFGVDAPIKDKIQALVDSSPKLALTDAQILLLDTYVTTFGICDHGLMADRPLALVAMHWEEDNSNSSSLYERIQQFEDRQVYKRFGLSLTEFLELPRDVCIKILDVSTKKQKDENNVTDAVTRGLEGALNKGKT